MGNSNSLNIQGQGQDNCENPQYVQENPVNNDPSTGAIQKTNGTPAGATSGSKQDQQTSASQPATRGRNRATKTDRRTRKTKTKSTSPNRSDDECSDEEDTDLMAPLMTDAWDRKIFSCWGHRERHVLARRLPSITAGAPAWIRTFEEETSGDVLAIGGVRAILGKAHGSDKTIELERMTHTTHVPDKAPFDIYRNAFWDNLKRQYPPDLSAVGIQGLAIKPEETIHDYVRRAEILWADKNDCSPYESSLANNTFRKAVLSGLPPEAQTGLETVVGLCVKPKAEWMEHLIHHLNLSKKKQAKKDHDGGLREIFKQMCRVNIEKDVEMTRQLKKAEEDQDYENMMSLMSEAVPQVTPLPEWLRQGNEPTAYAAYVADAMQQSGQQRQNQPHRGGGAGRGGDRPMRQFPCMHCNQMGHWIRNCPKYHSDRAHSRFPSQQQYQNTEPAAQRRAGNTMLAIQ